MMMLQNNVVRDMGASLRRSDVGLGGQLAAILHSIQSKPFSEVRLQPEGVGSICDELGTYVEGLPIVAKDHEDSLRTFYHFFSHKESDIDVFFEMLDTIRKGSVDGLSHRQKRHLAYCIQILSYLKGAVVTRYEKQYQMYKIDLHYNSAEVASVKKRLQPDVKDFMLAIGMSYQRNFRHIDPYWVPPVYESMQKYKSVALVIYVALAAALVGCGVLSSHLFIFASVSTMLFLAFAGMSVYEVLFDYSSDKPSGYMAQGVDSIELVISSPSSEYSADDRSSYSAMLSDEIDVSFMLGQEH